MTVECYEIMRRQLQLYLTGANVHRANNLLGVVLGNICIINILSKTEPFDFETFNRCNRDIEKAIIALRILVPKANI